MKLTHKNRRFVDAFLVLGDAAKAAREAGYSAATAKQKGYELRHTPHIAAEIERRQKAIAAKFEVTAERIAAELALIGFANMQDYLTISDDGDPYLDFSGLTREQAAAIAEVTVEDFKDGRGGRARDVRKIKFKLADKRAALVDLGKHLGMFKDKDPAEVRVTLEDVSDLADAFTRRVAGLAAAGTAAGGTGGTRSVH